MLFGSIFSLPADKTCYREYNHIFQISHRSSTCRKKKVFYTATVQTINHIPVDVKLFDVNMLSASAHKFNDPKGVAFLYIRDRLKLSPHIDGGGQEFSKRTGTENVSAIAAMALAIKIYLYKYNG